MTLKVLIVDDEELARLRLKTLLGDCTDPPAAVAGEAADAPQAVQWLAEHRADVALLDVQMPGADGTALAAVLRRDAPHMALVFVTAHPEHAVRAFELEAVDYLTKPVRRDRLQQALQRAAARLQSQGTAPAATDRPQEAVLTVSERGRVVRVPVAEVLYLKAELKYVTLRTARHAYLLDDSLADLEQRLGEGFIRVHRNALVARKAMVELERRAGEEGEGWAVRVAPTDEWLTVSRRQAAAVREAMEG